MKPKEPLSVFKFFYRESKTFASIVNGAGAGALLGLLIGGAVATLAAAIPPLLPAAPVILGICFTFGAVFGGLIGLWRAQFLPETTNANVQTSDAALGDDDDLISEAESPRPEPKLEIPVEEITKLVTHQWKKIHELPIKNKTKHHPTRVSIKEPEDDENEARTPRKHHRTGRLSRM